MGPPLTPTEIPPLPRTGHTPPPFSASWCILILHVSLALEKPSKGWTPVWRPWHPRLSTSMRIVPIEGPHTEGMHTRNDGRCHRLPALTPPSHPHTQTLVWTAEPGAWQGWEERKSRNLGAGHSVGVYFTVSQLGVDTDGCLKDSRGGSSLGSSQAHSSGCGCGSCC